MPFMRTNLVRIIFTLLLRLLLLLRTRLIEWGSRLTVLGNYTTRVGEGEHVYEEAAADEQQELREAPGTPHGNYTTRSTMITQQQCYDNHCCESPYGSPIMHSALKKMLASASGGGPSEANISAIIDQ